jgi:hypothetical protein
MYVTKKDAQSSTLYQKARTNLQLYNQPILICLINDQQAGYSTINFIESAIKNAASPLRIRFVIVTDVSSNIQIEPHISSLIKRINLVPTLNFVYSHTNGYLNTLAKALQEIQMFDYKAAVVARPAYVRLVKDFDKHLLQQTDYPSRILTGRSNRTFLRLKQEQFLEATLLPVIESFKLSPTVFGISSPYQATANAYASSYLLAFSQSNTPTILSSQWPDDLCHATDLFLTDLLLTLNLQLSTYDNLAEEIVVSKRSTKASMNQLTTFVADQNKIGRVFSKVMTVRTGLSASGVPASRRALLGLTDQAFMTNEAATKYGSVFRAQYLLKNK